MDARRWWWLYLAGYGLAAWSLMSRQPRRVTRAHYGEVVRIELAEDDIDNLYEMVNDRLDTQDRKLANLTKMSWTIIGGLFTTLGALVVAVLVR